MRVSTIIRRLKELEENWPDGYWLLSNGNSLDLMKCGEDGEQVIRVGGGFDDEFVVESFSIPNDGGDW